jgi:hypothetical protein
VPVLAVTLDVAEEAQWQEVAELALERFDNYRPVTQQRAKMIDAAFERAAQSPLLQHIVNQKTDKL